LAIYAQDTNLENNLRSYDWTGELLPTDRDYLDIVNTNLGATKTDLNVEQDISLTTHIGNDGTVTDELDITRVNRNPNLPDMNNVSFLRAYVPQGSQLLSEQGFDKKILQYPTNVQYQTDPDVTEWEKNSSTDNLTGTITGLESGKTFFGNWVELASGQSKTVKLVYELPEKLNSLDRYSLLLQKQLGSTDDSFNWTINYQDRQILWQNFQAQSQKTAALTSDIILDKDYLMGMVLKKGN
jgi:hypothetical protein